MELIADEIQRLHAPAPQPLVAERRERQRRLPALKGIRLRHARGEVPDRGLVRLLLFRDHPGAELGGRAVPPQHRAGRPAHGQPMGAAARSA
jgi:hypothetical protein